MRKWLTTALPILALIGPVGAAPPPAESPRQVVVGLYAAELRSLTGRGEPPWRTPERYFDTKLSRLLRLDNQLADKEGEGNLQFDPLCDGQDCRITDLKITPGPAGRSTALVDINLRNMGGRKHLVAHLTRGAAGWRIAELNNVSGTSGWRLDAVLNGADR